MKLVQQFLVETGVLVDRVVLGVTGLCNRPVVELDLIGNVRESIAVLDLLVVPLALTV